MLNQICPECLKGAELIASISTDLRFHTVICPRAYYHSPVACECVKIWVTFKSLHCNLELHCVIG